MKKMSTFKAKTITIGGIMCMGIIATLGTPLFAYSTPLILTGCGVVSAMVALDGSEKNER